MRYVPRRPTSARRGAIVPIVAVSLLVILLALALVLDRAWLDAAQVELLRTAEAGALGGAHALAHDDRLRLRPSPQAASARVQALTQQAAQGNRIAGEAPQIQPAQDIEIGKWAVDEETGAPLFMATDHSPNTVRVTFRLEERRDNPVALLLKELTHQPSANLVQQVSATADNRVLGVRATNTAAVPGIPLGILADDPTARRRDTWQYQIVQRHGSDRFSYDEHTHKIIAKPDGIPEIILTGRDPHDSQVQPNVALVDLDNGLKATDLVQQIHTGWNEKHLKRLGGEIRLPQKPLTLSATSRLTLDPLRALRALHGEAKICFLYAEGEGEGATAPGTVICVGLVAGRVMEVLPAQSKASQIVFQPAVVVTRTVILPEVRFTNKFRNPAPREWLNPFENRYLYKTCLTQ